MDSSLYVHIKEVKCSKEKWNKLKLWFDYSVFRKRTSLLWTLISIRRNWTAMLSYLTQIIETSRKLNGMNFNINGGSVASLLLGYVIWTMKLSGMPITTDIIRVKIKEDDSDTDGAVTTKKNRTGDISKNKSNGLSSKPK